MLPEPAAPPAPPARPTRVWPAVVVLVGLGALTAASWGWTAPPAWMVAVHVGLPVAFALGVGLMLVLGWGARAQRGLWPAALGALAWAFIWGRGLLPSVESPAGPPLRVLSWNVQRLGFEDAPTGPRTECVSAAIARFSPDVLLLQELSARDVERLAARLGLTCAHADYRLTGDPRHGGVAACARGDAFTLGEHGPRAFAPEIDWHYAWAELLPVDGGQAINLFSVHLQPYGGRLDARSDDVARVQHAEADALAARLSRLQDPTVVAGDFNSARDAPVHVRLRRVLRDVWEVGGAGPGATARVRGGVPLRIDYLYASAHFRVSAVAVEAPGCSDHNALLATLSRPAAAAQPKLPPSPR
jgi:endonuclease/exonuclease/phosphatase (EEP) superfamily protein YafD